MLLFKIQNKINIYKIVVSIMLGIMSLLGIFYSIRLDFNGTSINFALSLMLPMLVALAWGWKYGFISISLGLVFIYPFILGPYNGWASLLPASILFIWIGLHGWGSISRKQKKTMLNNMYFIQTIYILIKLVLYFILFQPLLKINIPFWHDNIMTDLGLDVIMIFAIKGVIVDSILLALCDSILLMPFMRSFFKLKNRKSSIYNTRVLFAIVTFGMIFTLIIMLFNNIFINKIDIISWLKHPDDGTILTLSLSFLLFIVMAGITVRYLQKNQEARNSLEKRNRQYLQVIEKINKMNTNLENLVEIKTNDLKQAVEEIKEFSFGVSHDLKSPIRAIDAYSLMLLEDNAELDVNSKNMIDSIKKHCSEMISLIDKILEYSVLSNKTIEIETINISEIIEKLITENIISNPERKLSFNIIGNNFSLQGDKILIKDAIGNIISNSVKYSKERNNTEIIIELISNDKEYIVSISDNGIGFDMKHQEKIFQIFQRLHSHDEYEGSGIGLTLAKKIILKHNGEIKITSIKNKGTKVDIIFNRLDGNIEKKEGN